jgi:hypothetical protein
VRSLIALLLAPHKFSMDTVYITCIKREGHGRVQGEQVDVVGNLGFITLQRPEQPVRWIFSPKKFLALRAFPRFQITFWLVTLCREMDITDWTLTIFSLRAKCMSGGGYTQYLYSD